MLQEIFALWHIIVASIGCLANFVLGYVTITKTPKATKSYATLIMNFVITDFLGCLLDLFLQIRFIVTPMNVTLIYVYNGLCIYTGQLSCRIGLSLLLHCFPHSAYSLLLSFIYRFYILHRHQLSRKTLIQIILLVYLPSLFQACTYWTAIAESDEILPLAQIYFPNYNLSSTNGIIGGVTSIKTLSAIFLIFHITIPIFPIYIAIFILRWKIMKNLMGKAAMMSKDAKENHRQILKCLTLQALIPSLFVIAVICYGVAQFGILTHPIIEYLIYASILPMPMLSPFTYLFYIRPYRVFCLRLFVLKRGTVSNRSNHLESTNRATSAAANQPAAS